MTRKDYILIADILRDAADCNEIAPAVHQGYCEAFAEELKRDNPNFDRTLFLLNAGAQI